MRARTLLIAILAGASCGKDARSPGARVPSTPAFANQAKGVAYVGSEACRSCHAETWSTFAHTGMGRSFYPLEAGRVIEDWTTRNVFVDSRTGLHYRMTRRDGKFLMRQFLLDAKGREIAVDERELLFVIGSAHHSRSYVVADAGKLFQAPVCWYTKDAAWDLCPGYEQENDYFSRPIDRTCVFCHNARMTLAPGARNAYAEPYPHGIDCERCHGPGALHVEKWAKGALPTGEGDPAIVNPKRLPRALRMQICFQCHLGDSKATERVSRYDRPLEDFRPGEPVSSVMVPLRYADALPHDFGLSSQADRMLLSRCYTESKGAMECVTCHDPHVTVYRAGRPTDFFDAKCLGCHARSACRGDASARAATRPEDDCVACHMRKTEPDDHRRTAFTDHWIRKRPADDPPRARRSPDLVPYLPDEFDRLPPSARAYYIGRGYALRAHFVPPQAQRPLWQASEREFREAIAQGNDRADALFFLGKAQSAQGKQADAARSYDAAYEKNPGDHDIAFAHGQALFRMKRLDDAVSVFAAMVREHPDSAAPLAERARALAMSGRYAEALDDFVKASALEPWNADLHSGAGMMLSALGRHAEAVSQLEAAVRCAPERPAIWDSYATILARAGRAADAREASARVSALRGGG